MSKKEEQRKRDAKRANERAGTRTRSWTFLVYPESAPTDWREIIDNEFIEWVESPLHDKDVNATGEAKKPHWHVLVMYPSVKTFEQVQELTERLGAPIPQKCASAKALVRYMAHMDNPEKAKYSISDIVAHGGADLQELLRPNSSDRYALIGEMMDFVRDNNLVEFEDLMDYAQANRFSDWYPLLCDNSAFVLREFLKSRRHRKPKTIDYYTGEKVGD